MFFGTTANQLHMQAERGHIQVIFGPMFSGKTTELFRRVRRYTVANKKCLVIKYIKDTRYSEEQAATHDRQTLAARSCSLLSECADVLGDYDVIGIDEGQFFPDVVSFADSAALSGKIVIVAALDGTFQRKPFGSVLELVPLAEHVTKLNAVCMRCFRDASFTKRLGSETEVEVIGGSDKYISVCRACFASPEPPVLPVSQPSHALLRTKKRSFADLSCSADSVNSRDSVPRTLIAQNAV